MRAMGFKRGEKELSRTVPPTSRGVDAVEPRPAAWKGARPALTHNANTPIAKSALLGTRSVGGRPILHEAKSARDARHGIRTH